MASPDTTRVAAGAAASAPFLKTTRRRPSPAEHARRVAWGHKTGAGVAAAYREELRKNGEA